MARAAELPKLPTPVMTDFQPAIRRQIQQAEAAARAHPFNAVAVGHLAMILDAYQQYDSAAPCYECAHRLDQHSFRWVYYLGALQVHQGKYDRAIVNLRDALRLKPDYLPARLKLAESLLAAGHVEESGQTYRAILKDAPDSPEAWYGQGRVEAARNHPNESIEAFKRVPRKLTMRLVQKKGAAHFAEN